MWLVLCDATDISSLWAYQGLKSRGLEPIELVNSELLSYSLHWEHHLNDKIADIQITLPDGRKINSHKICGVLNRLWAVQSKHLQVANPADRDYAIQEFSSFFVSWLNCLPGPLLNPPTPFGLSGHLKHASGWAMLASKAGLPTSQYRQTSYDTNTENYEAGRLVLPSKIVSTVIVVGDYVVGKISPELAAGCVHFAKLAKMPLLGVEFSLSMDGSWIFAGANPLPDLMLGGEDLLDKLAVVLRGEKK